MPPAIERGCQLLGVLHADGADKSRLARADAFNDVVDDGLQLRGLGLVYEIALVVPHHGKVGRHRDHVKSVGVAELGGFSGGRARHAGELVVEAEVVLQRDGGERLVFLFDRHPLPGLDCLVEALAPAPPFKDAARELVDDLHLAPETT